MTHLFEEHLPKRPANYQPLTPIDFLDRAAWIHRNKPAVFYRDQHWTYPQLAERCRRFASALHRHGVTPGDTVALMAPNIPPMLEAHFAVPMAGAVLNALNIRLDARTIAHILEHGEAKVLITDREFSPVIREALAQCSRELLVIDIDDEPVGELLGSMTYEAFLQEGTPDFEPHRPEDEWEAISLNYTSGTTGNPKGVVYHHRGAYLAGLCNPLMLGMQPESTYLWTLPMFHCNGWGFNWGVTAMGASHVCLRKFTPEAVFQLIERHRVTHLCGAPIILNALANAPEAASLRFEHQVVIATGGAAPPSQVIAAMEPMNFRVIHLYGLTESYGPATLCQWQPEWNALPSAEQARKNARQGVRYPSLSEAEVLDASGSPVPHDGETLGEIALRGNTLMKGYLKNPEASEASLGQGWFRTGDLAVMHPDGYLEIKDRSKDVIISGGENISSLEIEETLYRHPAVLEAAVVARPDATWGETPCAFVTLKSGQRVSDEELIAFCRSEMAHFKCPKTVLFAELPKTSTGKVQKHVLRDQAKALE